MKSILRWTLTIAVVFSIAPGSFAGTRFNPEYDDPGSEVCGPIDPYSPCYYPVGTDDCPANTSYDSCMKRCLCQYNKAVEKCSKDSSGSPSLYCKDQARIARNACEGFCLSDHPPALTPPVR